MPIRDEEITERLRAAASFAERAPWTLRAEDVMTGRAPARRHLLVKTDAPHRPARSFRPARRTLVPRLLVATFLLAVLAGVAAAVLTRGQGSGTGPSGSSNLTAVYAPATPVSNATLEDIAAVMRARGEALGLGSDSVSVERQELKVVVPNTAQGRDDLAVMSDSARLYFRPVLCAAPAYSPPLSDGPPAGELPLYVPTNITCPAGKRFTSADYDKSGGHYNPPALWAKLAEYASTPATNGDQDVPVLVPDPGDAYGPRLLLGPAAASDSIISGAHAQTQVTGDEVVDVSLTPAGARLFDTVAEANYDLPLGFEFGGRLVSAPIILAKSFTGLEINAQNGFTQSEAHQMAVILGHGTIPVPLRMVGESA